MRQKQRFSLPWFVFEVLLELCLVIAGSPVELPCVVTSGTTVVCLTFPVTTFSTLSDGASSWYLRVVAATVGCGIFGRTSISSVKPKLLQRSPVQHSYRQSEKSGSEQILLSSHNLRDVHSLLNIVVFLLREKAWTATHLSKRSSNGHSSTSRLLSVEQAAMLSTSFSCPRQK